MFGVNFHLKEIAMRYMEDNYKWSSKAKLNMGSFDNNKGITNTTITVKPTTRRGGKKNVPARPKTAPPAAGSEQSVEKLMVNIWFDVETDLIGYGIFERGV